MQDFLSKLQSLEGHVTFSKGIASFQDGSTFNLADAIISQWSITMPVISTAHLAKDTNDSLIREGDDIPWMHCACYETGFFVSVPTDDEFPENCRPPADLIALWQWARDKGHQGLRLDSDGDVIEGIPTYDW